MASAWAKKALLFGQLSEKLLVEFPEQPEHQTVVGIR
jgi:hypothetical protein